MFTTALAAAAALVSLAFAGCTFERWLLKRRPHELTWTISLLTFFLGALALAWGSAGGWNEANFRMFYLFGAIVNVPLLAVGQIELLSTKRWIRFLRPTILGCLIFAAGVLAVSPLKAPIPPSRLPVGREVFLSAPRVFAAVGSAGGAFVVFAGAIYSLVSMTRSRVRARRASDSTSFVIPSNRVGGTAIIALGTIVLSASGSLNKRFGEMTAFAITLCAGVVILFVGFIVATKPTRKT